MTTEYIVNQLIKQQVVCSVP